MVVYGPYRDPDPLVPGQVSGGNPGPGQAGTDPHRQVCAKV